MSAAERIIYYRSEMIALMCFCLRQFTSPFKSKIRLEAENAILRHQLIVLQRKLGGRVHFTNSERLFSIAGFPRMLECPSNCPTRGHGAAASRRFSSFLALADAPSLAHYDERDVSA